MTVMIFRFEQYKNRVSPLSNLQYLELGKFQVSSVLTNSYEPYIVTTHIKYVRIVCLVLRNKIITTRFMAI